MAVRWVGLVVLDLGWVCKRGVEVGWVGMVVEDLCWEAYFLNLDYGNFVSVVFSP